MKDEIPAAGLSAYIMKYRYEEIQQNIILQSRITSRLVENIFLQILNKIDIWALRKVEQVVLVGCGDSRIAGKAVELAFCHFAGISARAFPSLEFSRYQIHHVSPRSLLVAISYSGKVSRTIEAARLARDKELYTIGICRQAAGSPLAESVNQILELDTPVTEQIIPGCLSYTACLYALATLAVYMGEAHEHILSPQADEFYSVLKDSGKDISEIIATSLPYIDEYILTADIGRVWHIIGSGPNAATAEYGAVKLLEAASVSAIWYDIEEWAHTGYFLITPGTPLIILAPRGPAFDRFLELLPAIKSLNPDLLVITDSSTDSFDVGQQRIIRLAPRRELPEALSPVFYALPLQLLALRIAERYQTIPFHLDDLKRLERNSEQLYSSRQIQNLDDIGK